MPWYREENYDQLRRLFSDGARLHSTFTGWLAAATSGEAHLKSQGQSVVRVDIDPATFPAWCAERGIAADSKARSRYAGEVASLEERERLFAEAQADVRRRVRLASDAVERHLTPVFTYRESRRFDFEGSGIFASLESRYYLITAAHVLDACEFGAYLPALASAGEPLSGASTVTGRPATGRRDDDQLDIGFVRLSAGEVTQIGPENFLDLAHTLDGPPEEPVLLTIALGFPARDQRINQKDGTIQTAITRFMTGAADETGYRLAKVDPRSHVLLRYRRDGMLYNGQYRGSSPPFTGMSGGGVWPVSLRNDHTIDNPPPLGAMIIEQPTGYRPSILATRAPLIRAFLKRFDEDG
jgi:hypothetical protein